jgi:hypothetical protein
MCRNAVAAAAAAAAVAVEVVDGSSQVDSGNVAVGQAQKAEVRFDRLQVVKWNRAVERQTMAGDDLASASTCDDLRS